MAHEPFDVFGQRAGGEDLALGAEVDREAHDPVRIDGSVDFVAPGGLVVVFAAGPAVAPSRAAGDGASEAAHEPTGSNGFAIAPANSATGKALLFINPHTSFYFRAEAQMTSAEGLNAYGALTWGQFFIYQGFNERTGWMHTSSNADVTDEYAETVTKAGDLTFQRRLNHSCATAPDSSVESPASPLNLPIRGNRYLDHILLKMY